MIAMEGSAELAATALAAWSLGAIAAVVDPTPKGSCLAVVSRLVVPVVTVVDADGWAGDGGDAPAIAWSALASDEQWVACRSVATDPASIVFTSGSTGGLKGVTQSHGSLLRGCRAVAQVMDYRDDDCILCPVPWSFDYGWGQLLSTVVLGITQILPVPAGAFGIADALERHRPTVIAGVPPLLRMLARLLRPPSGIDVRQVRLVTSTGGAVSRDMVEAVLAAFPATAVSLNYGLTESYRTTSLPPALAVTRSDAVGRAIPGVDVIIVREDGSVAGCGEIGEVVHRGDYLCLGYWGDRAQTERVLRPDPLAPTRGPRPPRALFTGDQGALDEDGLLVLHGRRDRLLKPHGVRVAPEEIEGFLRASDLVEDAIVIGLPHDDLGHELWAVVAATQGHAGVEAGLRRYCHALMPAPMRPSRYLVVDRLPTTRSGKLAVAEAERLVRVAIGATASV